MKQCHLFISALRALKTWEYFTYLFSIVQNNDRAYQKVFQQTDLLHVGMDFLNTKWLGDANTVDTFGCKGLCRNIG